MTLQLVCHLFQCPSLETNRVHAADTTVHEEHPAAPLSQANTRGVLKLQVYLRQFQLNLPSAEPEAVYIAIHTLLSLEDPASFGAFESCKIMLCNLGKYYPRLYIHILKL
jgi:hypothetical protein